ncbi:hypothetical protein WDU94_007599, partial [Cyamophila willieti]
KIIAIQWVPAHCGLEGNEKADVLAKKGTKILATPQTNISFDSAKRLIKPSANNKHNKWLSEKATRQKWEALVKTPDIIPNIPRKASVAKFRLLTGHDCLAEHLHRIGCMDSPLCPLCSLQTPMNGDHLRDCPATEASTDIVGKYWDARGKMT